MTRYLMYVKDGALHPVDKAAMLPAQGEVVDVSIDTERMRSNPQNARYWSRLKMLSEAIPESMQAAYWDNLIGHLSAMPLDAGTLHGIIKLMLGVQSIGFDRLTHKAACKYYDDADQIIERMLAAAQAAYHA
jgi:hypothetical protein